MLKQLAKLIRRHLLKINWLRREVEAYKQEKEDKQYREDWARKMSSGNTVREGDAQCRKSCDDCFDCDYEQTDNTVLVDYYDTRMMGQRGVTPTYIRVRPFGMGRK